MKRSLPKSLAALLVESKDKYYSEDTEDTRERNGDTEDTPRGCLLYPPLASGSLTGLLSIPLYSAITPLPPDVILSAAKDIALAGASQLGRRSFAALRMTYKGVFFMACSG